MAFTIISRVLLSMFLPLCVCVCVCSHAIWTLSPSQNPPKDAPATLNQRGRKRQLTLLCFHTSILVDLLTSSMELEGSRSSNCSTIPQEHTHKNLAASFYPVLKQSQDILKNVRPSNHTEYLTQCVKLHFSVTK